MRISPLFQEISPSFFRPLTGRLATVYWAALETLYALDFEGEPFEITRETAIEQVAQLLEQTPEYLADPTALVKAIDEGWPSDEASESASVESDASSATATAATDAEETEREARRLARSLLRRLELAGWFDYEYRQTSKGYVLNFRDYAARILHTLTQVAKQDQPIFEGLAQGIKAALSPQEVQEKPGVALYNAQRATKDLVREIKILSRNIHRYCDRVLKQCATPKDLLELQLDIYQKKVVDSSYHRFKTSDNVFKYRSFILAQLDALVEDPYLHAGAVQWVSRNQAVEYEEANSRVDEWAALIRSQLLSIHVLTDDLDRKNARYTAATLSRINYLLHQDHLLEGRLMDLIARVQDLPESVAWAFEPAFAAFQVQTVDPFSVYVPPRERSPMEVQGVPVSQVPEEGKHAMLRATRGKLQEQYSRARVYRLAEELLRDKSFVRAGELPLRNPLDLVGLVFLSYHGRDPRAPFEFRLDEEGRKRARIGAFDVPEGVFAWKRGTERERQ